MKRKWYLLIGLCLFAANAVAQQNATWAKWEWLMGEWKGEGSGQPGQGSGTFSFKVDLDKKILVRKAHSEYPSKDGQQPTIHDDLLIVYPDFSGNPSKAIYFDNEGHTINYAISYSEKSIVLISDPIPNVPTFRLTYILLENNMVNTTFEMSQDGKKFMMYVEGKSKKVK